MTRLTCHSFLLLPCMKPFISSYVPQLRAVDGTFIIMRGYIPLAKADIPSDLYTSSVVYIMLRYCTRLTSKSQTGIYALGP